MQKKSCIFLSEEECNTITQYIFDTEKEVKLLGEDLYLDTAPDSLTGRFAVHNYLYTEVCGQILIPKIKNLFGNDLLVQCWANIFRKGEGILPHNHGSNFISGNIFLDGDESVGTFYGVEKVTNKKGELTFFNSEMIHHVEKNPFDKPRVSMAMDIYYMSNLTENKIKKMKEQTNRFFQITK